jgi:glycosyltransferase involved in cell wall biosynthesis
VTDVAAVGVTSSQRDDGLEWLDEFARTHGRPLRVLHVGNIANNAYLNAKFLREVGIDCHVMSYDYYDIMATPEWEGVEHRPEWFAQGPFSICRRYLMALNEGRHAERWARRQQLKLACKLLAPIALDHRRSGVNRVLAQAYVFGRRGLIRRWSRFRWLSSWIWNWSMRVVGLRILSLARRGARGGHDESVPHDQGRSFQATAAGDADNWEVHSAHLIREFDRVFPNRPDRLTRTDIDDWAKRKDWQALFEMYDVVQCYATDPIRALVSAKRPYVAYEHGTLRDFTLGDEPLHRLNALAYRLADHAFVTNGDCLAYAQMLGIEDFTPMIHPIDVEQHAEDRAHEAKAIRTDLDAEVLLLCPIRHDWAIKGTDVHLRALPAIVEQHGPRVVLALCEWGAEVERSRTLLSSLGCEKNVRWLPPLNRVSLIAHIHASDVVLDQMALPHFGATAPQALAAGRPVVMSYDPASTEWIVPEPAPILAAFSPAEVAAAVTTALDPEWRRAFEPRARDWIVRYHHPRRIVREHCRVYRKILGEK